MSSVPVQQGVGADVHGDQDPFQVAGLDQLGHVPGPSPFRLGTGAGRTADVIDLHVDAPLGDGQLALDAAPFPQMSDHDPLRRDALLHQDVHLLVGQVAEMGGVGGHGGAGRPLGPRGRPKHLLLRRSDVETLGADLADDAGSSAALHPLFQLLHQHAGQGIGAELMDVGRIDSFPVPAAPHDDVEAGGLGQSSHPGRVAPESDGGHVHQGGAACVAIEGQFLHQQLLVVHGAVVAQASSPFPGVHQGVFVHEGDAQVCGFNGPQHGLNRHRTPPLSKETGDGLPPGLPAGCRSGSGPPPLP